MTLDYVGHLCVVFAILWRSSTVSEYSLASLHGCFTCRGRRQVIQIPPINVPHNPSL